MSDSVHFLFPSDVMQPKDVDEVFRGQADALIARGIGVSHFSFEDLQLGTFKVRGSIPQGAAIVYRGWMMNATEYEKLVELITSRGATPFTPLATYLRCHHLPGWYSLIADLTAETRVFPVDADLTQELTALGWGKVFLKDYVKSLKTSVGSVVSKPEDAPLVVSEMREYRGTIEGGICVRRFESYRDGTEVRYFVLRGVPHAPTGAVPRIVHECAGRIESAFFSVDVAVRDDGVERVIEVGDGQVSDLVGWEPEAFAALWRG